MIAAEPSAGEWLSRLRAGELSAVELATHQLGLLHAADARLNAVAAFDPARTSGGSSGGEAALLGSGGSVLGIGTDGGGSIRVPSHYNGTAGLRPSARLVPETGCWPSSRETGMLDMACVGPMARTVD